MKGSSRLYTLMSAPGNLVLLLLFMAPLGAVVLFSFGYSDLAGQPHLGTTLSNYQEVLQPYFIPVVLRTLWYAAVTTALCLLLAYPVAYVAARFAGRFGPLLIGAVIMTWLVDYLVRIYSWFTILGDQGLVNGALGRVGIHALSILPGTPAVLAGLVYVYLPLMLLPLYSSLSDMPPALIDAGKDLYGTPRQTFWHVTLPATMPGVMGGLVITFFPALGDFATAEFLGGPNQSMVGNLIDSQFTNPGGSETFASALTVFLLLALVVGLVLSLLVYRRVTHASGGAASSFQTATGVA
jgi:spermidine/putrescine transport system permease protein